MSAGIQRGANTGKHARISRRIVMKTEEIRNTIRNVRDICTEKVFCDNCPFYRMEGTCPFSGVPSDLTDEEIERIIYQEEEE